jgi:predicted amidophosphoribosyltransferase
VLCLSCSHENHPGRKFCANCSAELTLACPSCGTRNEPAERFLGEEDGQTHIVSQ